jgi:hypothetical protein
VLFCNEADLPYQLSVGHEVSHRGSGAWAGRSPSTPAATTGPACSTARW